MVSVVGASLLLISALSVLVYFMAKFQRIRRMVNEVQGPRSFAVFGNALQFKTKPEDWFKQSDGVMQIFSRPRIQRFWMLFKPYMLIYGAEEAEVIMSSQIHINKGFLMSFVLPWLGRGLLTSEGEKYWRPRRKLLTPTFHYDILKDFFEVFNQEAKTLTEKLFTQKTVFDVYPYITRCALDVICETAMGRSVHAQENPNINYVTAVYKINDIIHERQRNPFVWPDLFFNLFGRGKEHEWCLNVLHGFTKQVIKERHEELKKAGGALNFRNNNTNAAGSRRRLAFLDLLLELHEQEKLTMNQIRNEVDTFMFEGHDTTSANINWVLHLLGNDQRAQQKVHEELDAIYCNDRSRDIEFDDLKHFQYLEWCIKEALRLYPSVPFISRRLEKDLNIVGFNVPQFAEVLVSPYGVHRDPRHWPDPETFLPERFSPENSAGRHPFAYIPFSGGNRNCIGQRFALIEEKTILTYIFRNFHVKSMVRRDQGLCGGRIVSSIFLSGRSITKEPLSGFESNSN